MARHQWRDAQGRIRFTYFDAKEDLPNPAAFDTPGVVTIPKGYGEVSGKLVIPSMFNPTPWKIIQPVNDVPLPDGFEDIFGPKPNSNNFHGNGYPQNFYKAKTIWANDLRTYVGPGMPTDADKYPIEAAEARVADLGLGSPAYYENSGYPGVDGTTVRFHVRFPDSQDPSFQYSFKGFMQYPDVMVVKYWLLLTRAGVLIDPKLLKKVPIVPPALFQAQGLIRKAQADMDAAIKEAALKIEGVTVG